MYKNKLHPSQLTAWLVGAMVPTVIQLTAGASWVGVLLSAALGLLWSALCWKWAEAPGVRLICLLQWVLLVAVMGALSQKIPEAWPRGGHKAVSLILLALALWSAWKGPAACAAVGCVLFWFTVPLYLILLGAGLGQVQPKWLVPVPTEVSSLAILLLLTPAAASIHLYKGEKCPPRLLLTVVLCTLAAAVTAGVLSPTVAAVKENPFYEMSRSLNLLGQARRLEAVVSAGTTTGWFSVLAVYLSLCGCWAGRFQPGLGKKGMAAAAMLVAASVLLNWEIHGGFLLICAGFCWVLLPISTSLIRKIKKSK